MVRLSPCLDHSHPFYLASGLHLFLCAHQSTYVWGPKCPARLCFVLVTLGRGHTESLPSSAKAAEPDHLPQNWSLEDRKSSLVSTSSQTGTEVGELSLQMYRDTLRFLFVLTESEYVQGVQPVDEFCTPAEPRASTMHPVFVQKRHQVI